MIRKRLIYMDHNSTTPTAPEVRKVMEPFYRDNYGNASSLHAKGREAHAAIEVARTLIGDSLSTESVDIIFTSGGTESNNMAIKSVARQNKVKGNHIITSSIEHLSVLAACRSLETEGFDITYLPVDEYGMVKTSDLKKAITGKTILVSIMHANNEVGTVQPLADIAEVIRRYNRDHMRDNTKQIYLHTDAVQSFGKIPVDVEELGVDLLSISAHKVYGPKGIGALYIRKGTDIAPYLHGGHHERNLRAGTENTPAIVGFAKSAELARKNIKEFKRVQALRDRLYQGLSERIARVKLNGHPEKRLPNTLALSFHGVEGESILLNFDIQGICVSAGSACTSGSAIESHVLEAMNVDEVFVHGSVRFSLGLTNTDADIDYCLREIPQIIERLRSVFGDNHRTLSL